MRSSFGLHIRTPYCPLQGHNSASNIAIIVILFCPCVYCVLVSASGPHLLCSKEAVPEAPLSTFQKEASCAVNIHSPPLPAQDQSTWLSRFKED